MNNSNININNYCNKNLLYNLSTENKYIILNPNHIQHQK